MDEPPILQLPQWSPPLFSNDYRYIAIAGGRGSAKSRTIATALVLRASEQPLRILCTREIQKSVRDSVKRLLDDEIDRSGFREMFKSTDTEIRGSNGSLFIFAGLQHNIDSIKSMEGIDICWCEEAQTLSQTSLNTLIPTIRKPGSMIWFSWNPKEARDPVENMFVQEPIPPRTCYLKVNYDQNPWFPDVLREEMEHDKKHDRGKYLHVWEGQYLTRSNANVFQDWRVEEFETPKDAFFRFGCDWGYSVDPTTLIRCFTEGRKLYFDYEAYEVGCEIDDTPDLFATVPESDRWPIIADSASPERISYMRKHGYPKMMKAVKGRKSIEEGIAFMQSFEIIVHPRCEHMIDELSKYKYKIDPITDEVTNVIEDKNNHLCIAEGTLVTTERGGVPIEDVTIDDRVLTRGGWQRVYATYDNGIRETIKVGPITCTPDHEILTSRGWLRADAVEYNDEILHIGESSCEKQSNSTVTNTTDTPMRQLEQREFITLVALLVALSIFTAQFGNIIMGLFLKGSIYTISTTTLLITTLAIWSVSLCPNMLNAIMMKTQIAGRSNASGWMRYAHSLKIGTVPRRGVSGIATMLKTLWRRLGRILSLKNVTSVMGSSCAKHTEKVIDFAQTSVSQRGEEHPAWMMLTAHATSAGQCLESINTESQPLAPVRVQTVEGGQREKRRVFDISVENYPEFFANGVLVANCDAARYSLEAVRRTVKARKVEQVETIPSINYWK